MTFYAALFAAKDLQIMSCAGAPPEQRPEGAENLVMHAQFSAGPGAPSMGSEVPKAYGTGGTGSSSVYYEAADAATAARIFAGLSEGATIMMALGPTSWSPAFGMLIDRFGTRWMISVP